MWSWLRRRKMQQGYVNTPLPVWPRFEKKNQCRIKGRLFNGYMDNQFIILIQQGLKQKDMKTWMPKLFFDVSILISTSLLWLNIMKHPSNCGNERQNYSGLWIDFQLINNIFMFVVCNKGMYGLGCRDRCGHCSNQSSCFYENGTCLKGCDPGFVGALCKTRMLNIIHLQQHIMFNKLNKLEM